jgi:hypothetical protein
MSVPIHIYYLCASKKQLALPRVDPLTDRCSVLADGYKMSNLMQPLANDLPTRAWFFVPRPRHGFDMTSQ